MKSFDDLTACNQTKDCIIYHTFLFDEKSGFPVVQKAIKISNDMLCISKFKEIQCLFYNSLLVEEMPF